MNEQNKETLVSIITPMYNAGRYVAKTIESVLAQTYPDWEMIIVDDCSTDGCDKIVKEYQDADSRIHYCVQPRNLGVAEARNRAIALAKGRYLAFLDSDDLWKPEKLEKQIMFLQKRQAAFVFSACDVIDGEDRTAGKVRQVPETVTYKDLLRGNVIPCLTVVLDRQKTGDVVMPKIPHEDYAAWLSVLREQRTAYGLMEPLASYRVADTSVSADKRKAMRWTWQIYHDYLKLGTLKSIYCFVNYVAAAVKKRV